MENKIEEILIIEDGDPKRFEERVNYYVSTDWTVLSSSIGFVNSESYGFCSSYQAIIGRINGNS